MTKRIALPAAFVAVAALTVSIEAAPKGSNSNGPKTTKTTTKAPSTTTTTKGSSQTKGPSPKSTSAKTDHAGGSKAKGPKSTTSGTSTTAKGNGSSKKTSSTTTASTTTGGTSPAPGTTTTWQPTNAVAEKLMTKPNQLAKLKAVVGDTVDINDATAGFKNFGQLNAAVNVSQNLGIEFADLKAAMTGITIEGDKTNQPTKSLGQAIHQLKPGVDAEAEAATATQQATRDGGQ